MPFIRVAVCDEGVILTEDVALSSQNNSLTVWQTVSVCCRRRQSSKLENTAHDLLPGGVVCLTTARVLCLRVQPLAGAQEMPRLFRERMGQTWASFANQSTEYCKLTFGYNLKIIKDLNTTFKK